MSACRRQYPGRSEGVESLIYCSLVIGLPQVMGGSAPALPVSGPAQRSLALQPTDSPSRLCDLLHRRLRRLCCLHRRSDCYRVERSSSRAGLSPAVDQRLFTAHHNLHGYEGFSLAIDRNVAIRTDLNSQSVVGGTYRRFGATPLGTTKLARLFGLKHSSIGK